MTRFSKCLGWLAIVVAIVMVLPSEALAQDQLVAKAEEIKGTVLTIMRVLFIIAAAITGYLWAKGSHEARDRTEKLLIGLGVAFSGTYLVDFFS